MFKVYHYRDLNKCRDLWERFWPRECLFDLWEFRACFARHYPHRPEFIVAAEDGLVIGMLPLSWIEDTQRYGFFPGELWQEKTWLEQNRIVSHKPQGAKALLDNVPGPMQLRYLLPGTFPGNEESGGVLDEVGYLFMPPYYDYAYGRYLGEFPAKSRKKMAREIKPLETRGIQYRFDHFPDVEILFRMNLDSFQGRSYFYDGRFLRSFVDLADWLKARGMLHITTLLIGGEIAAVDMGAVWNNQYTVLAGGTNTEFPGAAKIINFHHLEWSCQKRFTLVDFLCGDFGWKRRFHLQPRPLYLIDTSAKTAGENEWV